MAPKKKVKKAKREVVRRLVAKKRVLVKKKIVAKKKPVKKSVIKPKKKIAPKTKEKALGIITHYFPKVRAAVIKLKDTLTVGEVIKVKGHTTDFTQTVSSMQIDHVVVNQAKKSQEIGLLVNSRVRQNDKVYRA